MNELVALKRRLEAEKMLAAIGSKLSEALAAGPRRFHAILTHVGVNSNGLELTLQEARKAVKNFKPPVPLRMAAGPIKTPADGHPRSSMEVVGAIRALDLIETGGKPRIEFVGECFDDTEFDRKAFRLIQDGLYKHDSYEIDYAEGECSACGKRFQTPKERCSHLALSGNMVVGTDKGRVVMHGVTIKGVSILETPGADPKAEIFPLEPIKAAAHLAGEAQAPKPAAPAPAKQKQPEPVQATASTTAKETLDAYKGKGRAPQEILNAYKEQR